MSIHSEYSIIFDMDGVLVDSEPVIEAAALAGLAEFGVHARPEDFLPFVGAGEDRYIGGVAEKYGVEYKLEMKDLVYKKYLEIVPERLKVFEGTKELLDKLKNAGIKMALASSADKIKVEANLKVAGIPFSTFSTIVCGEDVVRKKPFPDIYLLAAERISSEPAKCIIVEDAVNGIRAAAAAGMKCIAIVSSFDRKVLEAEKPDYICNSISEVYSAIQNIT